MSLVGFVAGHPYAFLWARSFVQSTRTLAKLVHDTEWYLVLIKPRRFSARSPSRNTSRASGTSSRPRGWSSSPSSSLGLVWVFVSAPERRRVHRPVRPHLFSRSPRVHRLLPAPRPLDAGRLSTRFLAAFGLTWIAGSAPLDAGEAGGLRRPGRGRVPRPRRADFGRVFILAGDDTTAIAERWVRRNLPPGSVFGREWFTPELAEPTSGFEVATRPYLIYEDFPAFDKLDYVMAGSASYGFFYQYARYYPEAGRGLREPRDRTREDQGHLLPGHRIQESRGQDLFGEGPATDRGRASPCPRCPPWPARAQETEVLDGSIYGQDTGDFILDGGGTRRARLRQPRPHRRDRVLPPRRGARRRDHGPKRARSGERSRSGRERTRSSVSVPRARSPSSSTATGSRSGHPRALGAAG